MKHVRDGICAEAIIQLPLYSHESPNAALTPKLQHRCCDAKRLKNFRRTIGKKHRCVTQDELDSPNNRIVESATLPSKLPIANCECLLNVANLQRGCAVGDSFCAESSHSVYQPPNNQKLSQASRNFRTAKIRSANRKRQLAGSSAVLGGCSSRKSNLSVQLGCNKILSALYFVSAILNGILHCLLILYLLSNIFIIRLATESLNDADRFVCSCKIGPQTGRMLG